MALTITHATVASDPQDPRLGADDWNANHILTGFPCLGMKYNDDYYHAYSTTFHEGTTLTDYGITQSASGGNAQLSSNALTIISADYLAVSMLYLTTNAGATNVGGAYTRCFPNQGVWLTGDTFEADIGGVWVTDVPTAIEDYRAIACWLTANTAATSDEDSTTTQNIFFRADRNNTNWMLYYVDDSNVQQEIDTGVAFTEDVPYSFKIKVVQGATIAETTLQAWVNGSEVLNTSGLKAFSSTTNLWPARIEKLAGTTNRSLYVDRMAYLAYKPSGINART